MFRTLRLTLTRLHFPATTTSILSTQPHHLSAHFQVPIHPSQHPSPFSTTPFKMVKDDSTVIAEFNELVNMTASELESWLKEESSQSSGWSKDDGSGETIGHESGRKIIEILKKNPKKDPEGYEEEDLGHMRKVRFLFFCSCLPLSYIYAT